VLEQQTGKEKEKDVNWKET